MKPETHQELFDFAIKQRRSVIGEFHGRHESWNLRKWAIEYAQKHSLSLPESDESYGIYYEPDEEENADFEKAVLRETELDSIRLKIKMGRSALKGKK